MARHIDLVQDAEDATWAVLAYARRVEDSAENTVERAERRVLELTAP